MLQRLSEICRQNLLREKVLVAPSLAIGHQIADAIAQRGTPWVNLRIETVRTIADAVASFDIAQRGLTVLSRAQALAIVERACDRALGSDSYFAALAGRPGLHRAIQRSLDDLRHAGVRPDALMADAFEDPRKGEDLRRILLAYDEELVGGQYVDRFGVLSRAIEILRGGGFTPWAKDAIWLAVAELELTGAEETLLRLVGGELEIGASHSAAVESIEFRSAVGEENEIRAVFRTIVAAARDRRGADVASVGADTDPTGPMCRPLRGLGSSTSIADPRLKPGATDMSPATRAFGAGASGDAQLRLTFTSTTTQASASNPLNQQPDNPTTQQPDNPTTQQPDNPTTQQLNNPTTQQLTFDCAEIVYTTREPYLPLAIELAAEYDVPCTFAEGVPSYYTRPGQACLALLEWIGDGWHATALQAASTSGALKLEGVSGASFTRTLRDAAIGWGRERYLPRLDAILREAELELESAEDESEIESAKRDIERIRATRAAVESLLERTSRIAEGEIDLAIAAGAVANLVKRFAAVRNAIDGMARDAIVRMLEELAALPNGKIERSEAASRLAEAVREVHVSASNPQPGSLHIAPLRSGAWSGRSRIFVVGLDESRHPGRGLQDPVVLDRERSKINDAIDPRRLLLLGEAPQRAAEQFRYLLRRAAGSSVTLSYSALALEDRQERFPSAGFLEAYRDAGHPGATYEDVAKNVVRDGFVDPAPISATEWWLMRRFADGETDLTSAVLKAFPLLASGAEAEEARAGDEITPWDGRVNADKSALDPRLNGRIYSASQLESMASCTFKYFVERVLRVKAIEEMEYDPDRWLPANEFGSMLHEVLQRTMEELCAAGRKPSVDYLSRMREIAEAALEKWRAKIPPPAPAAYELGRDELLRACEIFLRSEDDACRAVTPKYFEVSFGFGDEGTETIAMPEPFELPLGHGRSIRLRGRIDRVDHDEANDEWHIWDYKSGMARDYEGPGRLQGGRKIQHALYAAALQEMLKRRGEKGKVTTSGYFFPTSKGRGARYVPGATETELKHALNALADVVGRGLFPHVETVHCKWCSFQSVCGGAKAADERMQRKMASNPDDEAVRAWNELQEIK